MEPTGDKIGVIGPSEKKESLGGELFRDDMEQPVNKSLEHLLDTWEREGERSPGKSKGDSPQSKASSKIIKMLNTGAERRGSLLNIIKTPELTDNNNTDNTEESELKRLPFQKNSTNEAVAR